MVEGVGSSFEVFPSESHNKLFLESLSLECSTSQARIQDRNQFTILGVSRCSPFAGQKSRGSVFLQYAESRDGRFSFRSIALSSLSMRKESYAYIKVSVCGVTRETINVKAIARRCEFHLSDTVEQF